MTIKALVLYEDVNSLFTLDSNDINIFNVEAINVQIQNLLCTIIGSRVKEPTFGSAIPELLFEPCDDVTAWQIQTAIWDALVTWFSDRLILDLGNTTVTPNSDGNGYIAVIVYNLLYTGEPGHLTLRMSKTGNG